MTILSTNRSKRLIVISTILASLLLNSYPFFLYEAYESGGWYYCALNEENRTAYNVLFWTVWVVGTLAIPCLLVFIFTILIVYKLMRAVQVRMELTVSANNPDVGANERQISRMFTLVAIAFLVLRTPYTVSFIASEFKVKFGTMDMHSDASSKAVWLATEVTRCMEIMNYAINFFLYYFSGSIFRQKLLKHVFCCKRDESRYLQSSATNQITRMTTLNQTHKKRADLRIEKKDVNTTNAGQNITN